MKYSRQRELILETVQSHPIHPSADLIYELVRKMEPRISLGTIYRNLNQLSENGQLLKIAVPAGGDRFDGRVEPHAHVICRRCGRLCDIETEELTAAIEERAARQSNYRIEGMSMVLYGLCSECQAGEQ